MSKARSGGISLGGAVFIVFLTLKLLDKVDWSWWWVTAPLWGGLALVLAFTIVWGVFFGIAYTVASFIDWINLVRRRRSK